jgi:hypothetical protein
MNTALQPGETLVKSGPANLQRGWETVGGKLHLTTTRLVFESHRFNVQTGATIVQRSDIAAVEKAWTKFLNLIPMMPNSIAVKTNAGVEQRYVVWGRDAWIDAIVAR